MAFLSINCVTAELSPQTGIIAIISIVSVFRQNFKHYFVCIMQYFEMQVSGNHIFLCVFLQYFEIQVSGKYFNLSVFL